MDLGIAGRVAVVTAASRGLGRASAEALAGEGVDLVLCARSEGPLAEAAEAVRALGVDVVAVAADVADPATRSAARAAACRAAISASSFTARSGDVTAEAARQLDPGSAACRARRDCAQARSETPKVAPFVRGSRAAASATGSSVSDHGRSVKSSGAVGARGASSAGTSSTASPSRGSTSTVSRSRGIAR